jgi:hypothetical protein
MFHWGKKKDFAAFNGPVDPNAQITPDETATILRLAELVPLVPPRQILLLLRQHGGNTDACVEKLLGMQTQFEQEAAAEKRLLDESAAVSRLMDSKPVAQAAPQPAQIMPSAPYYDEDKLNAVKKVTEHLAALERTYEQSFEVMERKMKDLQVENEAQRAEIALLHQQLRVRDHFLHGELILVLFPFLWFRSHWASLSYLNQYSQFSRHFISWCPSKMSFADECI